MSCDWWTSALITRSPEYLCRLVKRVDTTCCNNRCLTKELLPIGIRDSGLDQLGQASLSTSTSFAAGLGRAIVIVTPFVSLPALDACGHGRLLSRVGLKVEDKHRLCNMQNCIWDEKTPLSFALQSEGGSQTRRAGGSKRNRPEGRFPSLTGERSRYGRFYLLGVG